MTSFWCHYVDIEHISHIDGLKQVNAGWEVVCVFGLRPSLLS